MMGLGFVEDLEVLANVNGNLAKSFILLQRRFSDLSVVRLAISSKSRKLNVPLSIC